MYTLISVVLELFVVKMNHIAILLTTISLNFAFLLHSE